MTDKATTISIQSHKNLDGNTVHEVNLRQGDKNIWFAARDEDNAQCLVAALEHAIIKYTEENAIRG